MAMLRKTRLQIWCLLSISLWAIHAPAAEPPEVAGRIPADSVYAVFLSSPGEALEQLNSVLGRFKALSPELDLAKQGQQLKQEIGENLLTRAGLEAMGIDPSGTSAIFGSDMVMGPLVAVALKDAALFKQKLTAIIQKKEPGFVFAPKKKGGVEILEIDKGYIGLRDSWCLLLPPESIRGNQKDRQLLEFFAGGRKLTGAPAFKRAVAQMPDGVHVWFYLDINRLLGGWMKARALAQEEIKSYLNSLPPDRRKKINQEIKAEMAREKAAFSKWKKTLSFAESYTAGLSILPSSLRFSDVLLTKPSGARVLKKFFPAQSGAPAFHQGLVEPSVMGGWVSIDLMALLGHFESVPVHYQTTLKQAMQQEAKTFKRETKLDPFADILALFKGPAACYLLTPAQVKPDANLSLDDQVARLLRFACIAKTHNPTKTAALIKRFNQFISSGQKGVETSTMANASVTVFNPEPGVALSWGTKGDSAFLAFGEGTAESLAKILPESAWARDAAAGEVGSASMDFAVLTESISSAVNQGIGDTQFRMVAWPMIQQVLSKLGALTFSARLLPGGLTTTWTLDLR